MLSLFSFARTVAVAGAACRAPFCLGQNINGNVNGQDGTQITIAADGLTCTAATHGVIQASAFSLAVTNAPGSGGGGASKPVFDDLEVQKETDNCSLPLFVLSVNGATIKRVLLTEFNAAKKPALTITLDNARVTGSRLGSPASPAQAGEKVSFSYGTATITDAAGDTTGPLTQ